MTDSNSQPPLFDVKTLKDLNYESIRKEIASRTTFKPSRLAAEQIQPICDERERKNRLTLLREMLEAIRSDEKLSEKILVDLSTIDDPVKLIERLKKGGILTGKEIVEVEKIIPIYLKVRRAIKSLKGRYAKLKKLVDEPLNGNQFEVEQLEETSLRINGIFDSEGNIKDGADPAFFSLKKKLRAMRTKISEKAQALLQKYRKYLQDSYYTIREGRYVLPVRAEDRAKVKGIIHNFSSTSLTVFVEPDELIDQCNEMKIVEGEIEKVEQNIVKEFSALLFDHLESLKKIRDFLVFYDLLCGICRYGIQTEGNVANIVDQPVLYLKNARHPILILSSDRATVVPNDIKINSGQGWIVSGPNAGGKTILLKTAGVLLIMTYSGLPIPADAESKVGTFSIIRTVMGDEQSPHKNLSTFSAQVKRIAEIMKIASASSLILLDELATGTDPAEGQALAREIIIELVKHNSAAIMTTTHFENLKSLAVTDEDFIACAMGFDFESLEPTYKAHIGIPGISGGITIAQRFGIPIKIIQRAKTSLEQKGDSINIEVEKIEAMKTEVEKQMKKITQWERQLKKKLKEVETLRQKLIKKKSRELSAQQAYLQAELKMIREEIELAKKIIRTRPGNKFAIKNAKKVAGKIYAMLSPGGRFSEAAQLEQGVKLIRPEPDALKKGQKVFIKNMGVDADFEKIEGKKVVCNKDGKTIKTDIELIFLKQKGENMQDKGKKTGRGNEPDKAPESENEQYFRSSYNTVDVRGNALDEALIEIDKFIDSVREMGLKTLFIIHGHGKGILKNGIRKHLRHRKMVKSFRPGQIGEGGDGITVVELKE